MRIILTTPSQAIVVNEENQPVIRLEIPTTEQKSEKIAIVSYHGNVLYAVATRAIAEATIREELDEGEEVADYRIDEIYFYND